MSGFLSNLARRSAGLDAVTPLVWSLDADRFGVIGLERETAAQQPLDGSPYLPPSSAPRVMVPGPSISWDGATDVRVAPSPAPAAGPLVQRSPSPSVPPAPPAAPPAQAELMPPTSQPPTQHRDPAPGAPADDVIGSMPGPAPERTLFFEPPPDDLDKLVSAPEESTPGEPIAPRYAPPAPAERRVVLERTSVETVINVGAPSSHPATEPREPQPTPTLAGRALEPVFVPVSAPPTVRPEARPEERTVHVRIGAIEIHAAQPAAALSSPPPPVAPAPRPASRGFDEFARLRSYAPWSR